MQMLRAFNKYITYQTCSFFVVFVRISAFLLVVFRLQNARRKYLEESATRLQNNCFAEMHYADRHLKGKWYYFVERSRSRNSFNETFSMRLLLVTLPNFRYTAFHQSRDLSDFIRETAERSAHKFHGSGQLY
jgi:hypothetical protein